MKWWCYSIRIEIDLYLNCIKKRTEYKQIYIYTNVTEDDLLVLLLVFVQTVSDCGVGEVGEGG